MKNLMIHGIIKIWNTGAFKLKWLNMKYLITHEMINYEIHNCILIKYEIFHDSLNDELLNI